MPNCRGEPQLASLLGVLVCCWMCAWRSDALKSQDAFPLSHAWAAEPPLFSHGSPSCPPCLSSLAVLHTPSAELGCRVLNSHLQSVSNYFKYA